MKGGAILALLITALSCGAQADGGGRDVSIRLFSTQSPRVLAVAAAGPGAWWAPCVTCTHRQLTAALHMPAMQEIVAGGPLTVRDEEHGQFRSANGKWHLRSTGQGKIDVVLTLPSERYVAAVLMGETLPGEPRESLRAMAVVARTFVLRSLTATSAAGHLASDVCDSTACQAMRLGPVPGAVKEAVSSTAGETLWFGSGRAHVFFSGSCGGTTENAQSPWPKLVGLTYLRSIVDPYCVRKDRADWHGEITIASLQQLAMQEGWRVPQNIVAADVAERTSSQRARTIAFTGERAERSMVSAPALRLAVGRSLGWNVLRSDAYDVHIREHMLVFDGHGHGHGVGLCQQGATEMAREGKTYRDILGFYFPGTAVRVMRSDGGWRQSSRDGITFTGTAALTPEQMTQAVEAWRFAQERFPPRQQIVPSLTIAPSTEIFRQLTAQPGWQVASTSGSTVTLQPAAVLAANHVALGVTLRHEMLHVTVEANAGAKTPLWLREGLVEVLGDDTGHEAPMLSVDDTEHLLKSAGSWRESQAAHLAAGARARLLVERYGLSAVRGWLIAGSSVPND